MSESSSLPRQPGDLGGSGLVAGVLADDLSGAAESAVAWGMRIPRSPVLLDPLASRMLASPVLTVDADARSVSAELARDRFSAALGPLAGAGSLVLKVDSLLRGHVGLGARIVREALGRVPVVALGHPALGRVVRGGVLFVDGVPLHRAGLWGLEAARAPESVSEVFDGLDPVVVSADEVSQGVVAVAERLRELLRGGRMPVVDAATRADLRVVSEATARAQERPLLIGTAALVAVEAERLSAVAAAPDRRPTPRAMPRVRSLLMVIGSRAPIVRAQLAEVSGLARRVDLVSPGDLLRDPGAVARRLGSVEPGLRVVAIDQDAQVDPAASGGLTAALTSAVVDLVSGADAAFLTGGATARAVLEALGVVRLDVLREVGTGAVLSESWRSDGTRGPLIITRPGSFGEAGSLTRTAHALLDGAATKEHA